MSYVNLVKDSLWPGGKLRTQSVPRSNEEKDRTRNEANRKLSAVIPGPRNRYALNATIH